MPRVAPTVVTVAGTNGKGSVCATLSRLLNAEGTRTGLYTSPHLRRFNERIVVNSRCVRDEQLCEIFSRIDFARGQIPLTYFEFATLAAFVVFAESGLEVAILEVGLGGRLDAVNLVDADCTVITSIARDHEDWLGEDLDLIAKEKAGILRCGVPLIYGEHELRESVRRHAHTLACPLFIRGIDFDSERMPGSWIWHGVDASGHKLIRSNLPVPGLDSDNVAIALQALAVLNRLPAVKSLKKELPELSLEGRFQRIAFGEVAVLLDVAHNPAAAARLANRLGPGGGARTLAVFAAMGDKDIDGMLKGLKPCIEKWLFAAIPNVPRAASLDQLRQSASRVGITEATFESSVAAAMERGFACLGRSGQLLVFGSFYTVAEALQALERNQHAEAVSA